MDPRQRSDLEQVGDGDGDEVGLGGAAGPVGKRMKGEDVVEYDKLVSRLAARLRLARHPDAAVTVGAARLLIERLLSDKTATRSRRRRKSSDKCDVVGGGELAAEEAKEEEKIESSLGGETRIQRAKFSLADVELPRRLLPDGDRKSRSTTAAAAGDKEAKEDEEEKDELGEWLLQASRGLKLLYLEDQKQLQFRVNETISAIQAVTANPKTDARLLATGR